MIVCICNNVSDRDIRKTVNAGVTTMSGLRENLGVATCCGKCNACARQVLRECCAEMRADTDTTAFQPAWMPA